MALLDSPESHSRNLSVNLTCVVSRRHGLIFVSLLHLNKLWKLVATNRVAVGWDI